MERLSDSEILSYAQSLAGGKTLTEVKPGEVWTVVLNKNTGEKLTLRNVSGSKDETKARWTVDILGQSAVAGATGKNVKKIEVKFR
ncbi:hemagglutinin [Klebsiella oxytoca]|uniref:hemagglutinin n=1 Tax=Klebsiella oxytoca TaxID=571 RepID=UPI00157B339A|nr:hemagglutinin [Klebsiella oxytoca]